MEKQIAKSVTDNLNKNPLTSIAWNVVRTALWDGCHLSQKEIEGARGAIDRLLKDEPQKSFTVFCQRVLLAWQYINYASNRYASLPSTWLDETQPHGYKGTLAWYQKVEQLRQSLPLYKEELRAFPEAVLEMSADPTPDNYQYWCSYFRERHKELYQLFIQVTANACFAQLSTD